MTAKPIDKLLKDTRIADVINPRLIQAPPTISVKNAIEYMRENESAYIVVAKAKKVVGMFTESDVVQKILEKPADWKKPVSDFMTKDPLVLRPEDSVEKAVDVMAEHAVYHIPLVDKKGQLCGVLSVRTIIRFLAEFYPSEIYNLPPNLHQVMQTPEGG